MPTELSRPPILHGFRESSRMVTLVLTVITVCLGLCRSNQNYRLYGIADPLDYKQLLTPSLRQEK
jgi:hypothetical protein